MCMSYLFNLLLLEAILAAWNFIKCLFLDSVFFFDELSFMVKIQMYHFIIPYLETK